MKIRCEDVGNVAIGAAAGTFICTLGGAGSSIAQDLTNYQGNLIHMGFYGGMVTYPIVYGTALGILGRPFLSKPWTISDILITAFSTIPVSMGGTLLGYAFIGDSNDSLADTAKNAALGSAFLPLVTTTLVGVGYGLYKAISFCTKTKESSQPAISVQAAPEVNQVIEPTSDTAALTHQSQLLEEGRANYQAVATVQRGPGQLGLFPSRSNPDSATTHGVLAPAV